MAGNGRTRPLHIGLHQTGVRPNAQRRIPRAGAQWVAAGGRRCARAPHRSITMSKSRSSVTGSSAPLNAPFRAKQSLDFPAGSGADGFKSLSRFVLVAVLFRAGSAGAGRFHSEPDFFLLSPQMSDAKCRKAPARSIRRQLQAFPPILLRPKLP